MCSIPNADGARSVQQPDYNQCQRHLSGADHPRPLTKTCPTNGLPVVLGFQERYQHWQRSGDQFCGEQSAANNTPVITIPRLEPGEVLAVMIPRMSAR
jgi:hypothetical protein